MQFYRFQTIIIKDWSIRLAGNVTRTITLSATVYDNPIHGFIFSITIKRSLFCSIYIDVTSYMYRH